MGPSPTANAKPPCEVALVRRFRPNHPEKWRHVGIKEFAAPIVDGDEVAFGEERREAPDFLALIAVIAKEKSRPWELLQYIGDLFHGPITNQIQADDLRTQRFEKQEVLNLP